MPVAVTLNAELPELQTDAGAVGWVVIEGPAVVVIATLAAFVLKQPKAVAART